MALLNPNDEKRLLERLQSGDQEAFEQLYHFHKKKLAGNLLRLLKSEELVEEVLQELFLKIWVAHESVDPQRSFRSFLFRVAENLVYDLFRKSARDKRVESYLMSATSELYSHIEEDIFSKENHLLLQKAIDKLPPQRKKVFTLFKIEGKSYKEISEELGISHPTINEHIQKATQFLKNEINPSSTLLATLLANMIVQHIK